MIEIELPDGTIAEFPDDMSHDAIKAVLAKRIKKEPGALYQNVIGYGAIDTPGEKLGATVKDAGKALFSGIGAGATGLATLPSNMMGLLDAGVEKAFGIPAPKSALPDPGAVIDDAYQSTFGYTPKTRAGKFAGTVGEFLPGVALGGTLPQMVSSGIMSEAAGQLTEGTKAEPYARIGGGILGPVALTAAKNIASRIVSPNAGVDPARLRFADQLKTEGVPLTAGQKVGNAKLQYHEALAPRMADVADDQARQFTSAAMRRVGVDGLATPDNLTAANAQIGGVFESVAKTTPGLAFTKQSIKKAGDAVKDYNSAVGTAAKMPSEILAKIKSGKMSGGEYLRIWSKLGKQVRSSDGDMRDVAHALREVLDDAMVASLPAETAAKLSTARTQYRDLLAIEKAAGSAGENAAFGIISPAQLRTAIKTQGGRQYVQGSRDLGELARAGTATMRPLPQSGTQPRMAAAMARTLGPLAGGGGAGAAIGGLIGGPGGAAVGGGLGLLAPALANVSRTSRLGQLWQGNQLFPRTAYPGTLVPGILPALTQVNK